MSEYSIINEINKLHREITMEKSNNKAKNIIIAIAIVGGFLGIVLLIMILVSNPKEPATAEQVWDVMVAQGYQPQDITERYYDKDSAAKQSLNKCIAFQKDDIHFEFYDFNNKNSAIDVYSQAYRNILLEKNASPKVETKNENSNYSIYTLRVTGTYNVAIYVENTAIYAYCDEKNANEINLILDAIDYLN